MRVRLLFSFFLMFLSGILLSVSENTGLKIFASIFALVYSYIFYLSQKKSKRRIIYYAIFLAAFLAALFRGIYAEKRAEEIEKIVNENEKFLLEGNVYKKERKDETDKYYVRNAKLILDNKKVNIGTVILVESGTDEALPVNSAGGFWGGNSQASGNQKTANEVLQIGSFVEISGKKLDIREAQNEGGFDEKSYLSSKEIFLKLKDVELHSVRAQRFSILRLLYRVRESTAEFFEKYLPGEEGSIASAMALGAKELLSSDVKELFSSAGIAFLLVVSGQHISLVGLTIFKLLRKAAFSFQTCFFLVTPIVFLYALMTGFSVSCQRAVIMFTILLTSKAVGEEYDMLTSASVAGIIILFINPLAVFDSGAVFSFAASFVLAPSVIPCDREYSKLIKQRHKFEHGYKLSFIEKTKKALLSAVMIYFGLLPVISYYFYEIPVYQVLLSVILMPLSAVLIPLVLCTGLFRLRILMPLVHVMIYFLEMVSDASLHLPFSNVITGKPGLFKIILYYAVFTGFTLLTISLLRKKTKESDRLLSPEKRKVLRKVRIKYAGFSIAAAWMLFALLFINPPSHFEISMLSVGQGDGIFLSSRGGSYYFIDGGSSSEKQIGKYTVLPFLKSRGVRGIDAWFITHTDSDHVSGLLETLDDGYRIKRIIFSEYVVKENENYAEILAAAEKNNTEVLFMKKGDVVSAKSFCLQDVFAQDEENRDDANANSLCLYLTSNEGKTKGFSMLFTGDASADAEKQIASDYFSDGQKNVTILKSTHHGSKYSNSEYLLDSAKPSLVIISAGKNNMYHHPSPETLERFKDRNIPYYCTIQCGQIKILPEKKKIHINTCK